jgi:hypothetical protein
MQIYVFNLKKNLPENIKDCKLKHVISVWTNYI